MATGMIAREGGGYDFVDAAGNPISALTYANSNNYVGGAKSGVPFYDLLHDMAGAGDKGAGNYIAYNLSGQSFPADYASAAAIAPNSSWLDPSQQNSDIGNALTWYNAPTGSGLSASDAASYDTGIANLQSGLNNLDPQRATGIQNIDQSLQSALQQLLQGRNQAEGAMGQTKTRAGQDYSIGKNTINSYAGAGLQGLRRLMGSRGAGGGSAYTQAAPGAAAREATLQRNDLGRTYGQNMQDVDTGWNNYLQGYGESVQDVNNQGITQKNTLEDTYRSNKASILQQIAQLTANKTGSIAGAQPYIDQANQLLGQVGRTANPTFQYNTQAYQAPSLGSYTASRTTPTFQGQQQGNDFTSPYLQALLGKKKTNLV
jgi:hypothetical protein